VAEPLESGKGHPDAAGDRTAPNLDDPEEMDNLFHRLVTLYWCYDAKGQLHRSIPANAPWGNARLMSCVERHLFPPPLKFASTGQRQQYLRVKLSEIIFLKRLRNRMGRIEQHYKDMEQHHKDQYLRALREKQAKAASSPAQWREEQQTGIKIATHRVKVVKHVTSALPGIIGRASEMHRELEAELDQLRKQEEESQRQEGERQWKERERARVEGLRSECAALREEQSMLDEWISSVVPCATIYFELEARWTAVYKKKELADAAYKEATMGSQTPEEVPLPDAQAAPSLLTTQPPPKQRRNNKNSPPKKTKRRKDR
jgi:hypothetical protein